MSDDLIALASYDRMPITGTAAPTSPASFIDAQKDLKQAQTQYFTTSTVRAGDRLWEAHKLSGGDVAGTLCEER